VGSIPTASIFGRSRVDDMVFLGEESLCEGRGSGDRYSCGLGESRR
jgi:hypothetical protein